MSSFIDELDTKDKKLRKNWLKLNIFQSFIFPTLNFLAIVSLFTVFFCNLSKQINNAVNISTLFSLIALIFVLFLIILGLRGLLFWWIYHCAYKKHGTALLLFFLICTPLGFFSELYEIFRVIILKPYFIQLILETEGLKEHASSIYSIINSVFIFLIISMSCSMILTVWWFISSIKLRKMNKKLKTLMNPPTPTETLANLAQK